MKKIINPWKGMDGYYCFGCAPNNEAGVKMDTLLDEICAWVIARKLQTTGVTSKMETRYMKSIMTTDDYVVLRARIREQKRNIILVDASIFNMNGEECTKATCTYFTFSKEKAQKDMFFNGCETEEEDVNPLI